MDEELSRLDQVFMSDPSDMHMALKRASYRLRSRRQSLRRTYLAAWWGDKISCTFLNRQINIPNTRRTALKLIRDLNLGGVDAVVRALFAVQRYLLHKNRNDEEAYHAIRGGMLVTRNWIYSEIRDIKQAHENLDKYAAPFYPKDCGMPMLRQVFMVVATSMSLNPIMSALSEQEDRELSRRYPYDQRAIERYMAIRAAQCAQNTLSYLWSEFPGNTQEQANLLFQIIGTELSHWINEISDPLKWEIPLRPASSLETDGLSHI